MGIVVLDGVDLVVLEVGGFERVGDEGIVEPLELVGGDVQMLQPDLSGEKSIKIFDQIFSNIAVGEDEVHNPCVLNICIYANIQIYENMS